MAESAGLDRLPMNLGAHSQAKVFDLSDSSGLLVEGQVE
jgi:hypothetical protein